VRRAAERVLGWGWEPRVGTHAAGRRGYFAASDGERAADLNAAIRDPGIAAIWCLRGGYGTMRILDAVDWDGWCARPVPLIGFSDNTALHLALRRRSVVSLHGPHAAAVDLPLFAKELLLRLLTRDEAVGTLPFPSGGHPRAETVRGGCAEGPLVGGNLALLAATLGTPYAVRAEGAILFMEEVGESAYRVDRLLTQLQLAGVLGVVAGVAVGAFTEVPGEGSAGTPPVAEVIAERLDGLGVPVALGFPFGHVAQSWTLPMGVRARLDADAGTLTLLEPALRSPRLDAG
jgi:muramoyltetrapeptide carboxypeptidase